MALIPNVGGRVAAIRAIQDNFYKSEVELESASQTYPDQPLQGRQRIRLPITVEEIDFKVGDAVICWASPLGEVGLWGGEAHKIVGG